MCDPPSFGISISTSSLFVNDSDYVVGEVWYAVGDFAFPCERWSDFVLSVLERWCQAIQRLWGRERGREYVAFLDGGFGVLLTVEGSAMWMLEFIEETPSGRRVARSIELPPASVLSAVLRASSVTMQSLKEKSLAEEARSAFGRGVNALAIWTDTWTEARGQDDRR